METITIVSNAAYSKILEPTNSVKELLTEALSYFVNGYENMSAFRNPNNSWDGRSTMFDWGKASFPSGYLETVKSVLKEKGYEIVHLTKPRPEPLGILHHKLLHFDFTGVYSYQTETTEALEKFGAMIAFLATGAGKTNAAAIAIKRIKRNTLILTKRQPLMYQFAERLKPFGLDAGLIGDGVYELKEGLNVCMAQTLNNKIEAGDKEILDYLKTVEFIIGEEAHEVSDNTYLNVVMHCPNAYYKLALSATPFMKNNSEANMKLLGAFGPVGISVSEKYLIDNGILARPIIKYAIYEKPDGLRYGSNYQKSVGIGLVNAVTRNDVILKEAQKAKEAKLPVLVLVHRKEHGSLLKGLLEANGLCCEYIFGSSKAKQRKDALEKLAKGKIDVLIGSTIVDVGVDVPAIGLVILAGGGKAEVALRQRVGRGLRRKSKGPNVCFILDFMDIHNEHLERHFLERAGIINSTPGFAENILREDEQFPYYLFTKSKT